MNETEMDKYIDKIINNMADATIVLTSEVMNDDEWTVDPKYSQLNESIKESLEILRKGFNANSVDNNSRDDYREAFMLVLNGFLQDRLRNADMAGFEEQIQKLKNRHIL